MPIRSETNLYPGINPHLNSLLQNEAGGWESFHADHVTDLGRGIDKVLPSGYFARAEKSLQISELTPPVPTKLGDTKPDVTVYRSPAVQKPAIATLVATPPTATKLIPETLVIEEPLTSTMILQAGEGGLLGRPIARIELLSPSNKPGGSHYSRYMEKRLQSLQSGLRLVEIDYLHETPPILPAFLSYPDEEEGAFPYTILVTDPRPNIDTGYTQMYGMGVLDRFPVIKIPLAGADEVVVDLNPIYKATFDSLQFYQLIVDYAQEPVNFDRYSPADRERIRAHMQVIAQQGN